MLLNKIILIYLVIHLLISITCFIVFCDSFTSKRYNGFVNNNLVALVLLSLFAPVILIFILMMAISEFAMNIFGACLESFFALIDKVKGKNKQKNS